MKRKSKFTFFELKVTFYFDLFQFFIGGYYDHINKSVHLSLIPTLFIKLENGRTLIKGTVFDTAGMNTKAVEKASKELLKYGKGDKKKIIYKADSKGRMKLQKDKKAEYRGMDKTGRLL